MEKELIREIAMWALITILVVSAVVAYFLDKVGIAGTCTSIAVAIYFIVGD